MSTSVLAQIAALKSTPVAGLKARWRELFGTEPPPRSALRSLGFVRNGASSPATRYHWDPSPRNMNQKRIRIPHRFSLVPVGIPVFQYTLHILSNALVDLGGVRDCPHDLFPMPRPLVVALLVLQHHVFKIIRLGRCPPIMSIECPFNKIRHFLDIDTFAFFATVRTGSRAPIVLDFSRQEFLADTGETHPLQFGLIAVSQGNSRC
jgi:hypothetical protein